MLPPIEQISNELGSGGYQRPSASAARLTSTLRAPGSTTATRLAVSISTARHPLERQDDATVDGERAARQPRPGPARHDGDAVRRRPAHRGLHLLGALGPHGGQRRAGGGVWVQSNRYFSTASGAVTTTPSGSAATSSATARSASVSMVLPCHLAVSAEVVAGATTSALEVGAVENSAADACASVHTPGHGVLEQAAAAQPARSPGATLRELQVARAFVRNKLLSGRWKRRTEEVLTTTTGPLSFEQRLWVAVLHCGPDALVGGLTAAEAARAEELGARRRHVLVPEELLRAVPGCHVFRTRRPLATLRHPSPPPHVRSEPAVLLCAGTNRRPAVGDGGAVTASCSSA